MEVDPDPNSMAVEPLPNARASRRATLMKKKQEQEETEKQRAKQEKAKEKAKKAKAKAKAEAKAKEEAKAKAKKLHGHIEPLLKHPGRRATVAEKLEKQKEKHTETPEKLEMKTILKLLNKDFLNIQRTFSRYKIPLEDSGNNIFKINRYIDFLINFINIYKEIFNVDLFKTLNKLLESILNIYINISQIIYTDLQRNKGLIYDYTGIIKSTDTYIGALLENLTTIITIPDAPLNDFDHSKFMAYYNTVFPNMVDTQYYLKILENINRETDTLHKIQRSNITSSIIKDKSTELNTLLSSSLSTIIFYEVNLEKIFPQETQTLVTKDMYSYYKNQVFNDTLNLTCSNDGATLENILYFLKINSIKYLIKNNLLRIYYIHPFFGDILICKISLVESVILTKYIPLLLPESTQNRYYFNLYGLYILFINKPMSNITFLRPGHLTKVASLINSKLNTTTSLDILTIFKTFYTTGVLIKCDCNEIFNLLFNIPLIFNYIYTRGVLISDDPTSTFNNPIINSTFNGKINDFIKDFINISFGGLIMVYVNEFNKIVNTNIENSVSNICDGFITITGGSLYAVYKGESYNDLDLKVYVPKCTNPNECYIYYTRFMLSICAKINNQIKKNPYTITISGIQDVTSITITIIKTGIRLSRLTFPAALISIDLLYEISFTFNGKPCTKQFWYPLLDLVIECNNYSGKLIKIPINPVSPTGSVNPATPIPIILIANKSLLDELIPGNVPSRIIVDKNEKDSKRRTGLTSITESHLNLDKYTLGGTFSLSYYFLQYNEPSISSEIQKNIAEILDPTSTVLKDVLERGAVTKIFDKIDELALPSVDVMSFSQQSVPLRSVLFEDYEPIISSHKESIEKLPGVPNVYNEISEDMIANIEEIKAFASELSVPVLVAPGAPGVSGAFANGGFNIKNITSHKLPKNKKTKGGSKPISLVNLMIEKLSNIKM